MVYGTPAFPAVHIARMLLQFPFLAFSSDLLHFWLRPCLSLWLLAHGNICSHTSLLSYIIRYHARQHEKKISGSRPVRSCNANGNWTLHTREEDLSSSLYISGPYGCTVHYHGHQNVSFLVLYPGPIYIR